MADQTEEALFSNDPESEKFPALLERLILLYAALVAGTDEEEILGQISDLFDSDFDEAETRLLDFEQKLVNDYFEQASLASLDFLPEESPALAEIKHRLQIKKIAAYFSYSEEAEELSSSLAAIDEEAKEILKWIQEDPDGGMDRADEELAQWEADVLRSLYPDLFGDEEHEES
ncbi:MAG: hypothetical protein KDK37_05610 [Leptospiraceae bacterium]|nr:hypothetical protein [Leptospiraceae bacterium]MCB1303729.1 hypothetical protein [Leptospiraceae bacterium]